MSQTRDDEVLNRDERLTIRLRSGERAMIELVAEEAGVPPSTWIRNTATLRAQVHIESLAPGLFDGDDELKNRFEVIREEARAVRAERREKLERIKRLYVKGSHP